jgi:hypothetical protein
MPTIQKKIESRGQYDLIENVEYSLRDKDGKIKPLFQENALYTFAMKRGILSPYAYMKAGGILSPFLGHWSKTKTIKNLMTNAGFALVAGRLNGSGSPAAATYIAVGTGTNAAAAADTALQTETTTSGLGRAAGSVSLVTTTVTNDTAQIVVTFTVTGIVAVTESGVFNASSAGTLLCRQVFSAITTANGDSLQITWKIKAS